MTCGTEMEKYIFDSCRALMKGERFDFVFRNIGKWGYHDHLNSEMFGLVSVNG